MGKNFTDAKSLSPAASMIQAAQEAATPAPASQEPADLTPEEKALRGLKTQGNRSGLKNRRINMAFEDENYDYIHTMARIKGLTLTQYLNVVIAQERARNGEQYEAAKKIVGNMQTD